MASNSTVYRKEVAVNPDRNTVTEIIQFHDGVSSTDDGNWVKCNGWESMAIRVSGITTGTVQVYGFIRDVTSSGLGAAPANGTDYTKIGSDVTSDGWVTLQQHEIPDYIKFKVSAASDIDLDVKAVVVKNVN